MPITREDLTNQALALFGGGSVASFEDETPVSQSASQLYPLVRDSLFQHDWHFSRVSRQLSRVAETPLNGYAYVYELPGDMVLGTSFKVLNSLKSPDDPVREYSVDANRLYAQCTPVYLRYSALKEPEQWPPLFRELFVHALAVRLILPITGSASLYETFSVITYGTSSLGGKGGLFGVALDGDARQGDTPTPLGYASPFRRHQSPLRWRGV